MSSATPALLTTAQGRTTKVQWSLRRHVLHHQDMSISPSRRLRRRTLVPLGQHGLSEGVLITENGRTVLNVVGGPVSATLGVFAAGECVGSITLDHLGAGSAAWTETETGVGHSLAPMTVRYGGCTLLEGFFGSAETDDSTSGDRP